jgi:hypothetical protein
MMASTAAPIEAQLADYEKKANAQDSKLAKTHIAEAKKKNAVLNKFIADLVNSNIKAGAADGSAAPNAKAEKKIEAAQEDLVESLKLPMSRF